MNKSNALITILYPIVEQSLKNKNNINKLNISIANFLDKNSEILQDIGPSDRLIFSMNDREAILTASNLNELDIKKAVKESDYINAKWHVATDPINISGALISRYFLLSNNKKELELFLTYFGCYMYALLHYQYFQYGANRNIMDFTINNLSNKYKIKQLGSVLETIKNTVMTSHSTYEKELIRGTDEDLVNYISSLRVRINDFLKNIKREYTKNHDSQNYLNYDSDDYSEENYHIADNTLYMIKRITDATVLHLNTYGANMKIASFAAQLSKVSINEVRNVVTHLSDKDTQDVSKLCELILLLFLTDNKNSINDIKTQKFFSEAISIYAKSNTKDKLIIDIKTILDKWLNKYSSRYRKTNREATLSYFRKAIYIYFVLYIQNSNK